MKGKLITLESSEGAGKGTASDFLRDCIRASGRECVWTREPGGTPMAEFVRETMLRVDIDLELNAREEAMLVMAGRASHNRHVIKPALADGKIVFSERYYDSTYVYQHYAGDLPLKDLIALTDVAECVVPDITFYMDLPPEVGFARMDAQARQRDRFESRPIEFFHKVRNGYMALVRSDDTGRFRIIDAEKPLSDVRAQFINYLVADGIMSPEAVDWIRGKYDVAS